MTNEALQALLERRILLIRNTLARKNAEYAPPGGDALHNFKEAADLKHETPGEALLGMLVKHWVSIQDMVRAHLLVGQATPHARIDEKIGDAINYLVLLEAILKEAPE